MVTYLNVLHRSHEFDVSVEAKLRQIEDDCILTNHRNTKSERDHANHKRREGRARKAATRKEDEDTLEDLDAKIREASEATKASQTLAKELCEKKKELKTRTGIKQQRSSKGSWGKTTIPEECDLVDIDENTNPDSDAGASSQSRSSDLRDSSTGRGCQLSFHSNTFSGYGDNARYVGGDSWHSTPLDPSLDPMFMVHPTPILEDQLNLASLYY